MNERIGSWEPAHLEGMRGLGVRGLSLMDEVSGFARDCLDIDPSTVDLAAATRAAREGINARIERYGYRVEGDDLYRVRDDALPLPLLLREHPLGVVHDYGPFERSILDNIRDDATGR